MEFRSYLLFRAGPYSPIICGPCMFLILHHPMNIVLSHRYFKLQVCWCPKFGLKLIKMTVDNKALAPLGVSNLISGLRESSSIIDFFFHFDSWIFKFYLFILFTFKTYIKLYSAVNHPVYNAKKKIFVLDSIGACSVE